MDNEQILKEIKTFLKDKTITPSKILRDIGIDSLDLLDLILEVEDKFNIKIEDDELLKMETIQDVIDVIKTKF